MLRKRKWNQNVQLKPQMTEKMWKTKIGTKNKKNRKNKYYIY